MSFGSCHTFYHGKLHFRFKVYIDRNKILRPSSTYLCWLTKFLYPFESWQELLDNAFAQQHWSIAWREFTSLSKVPFTALGDFLAKPLVVAILDIFLKHYWDFDKWRDSYFGHSNSRNIHHQMKEHALRNIQDGDYVSRWGYRVDQIRGSDATLVKYHILQRNIGVVQWILGWKKGEFIVLSYRFERMIFVR